LSHALGLLFWLTELRCRTVSAVTANLSNGIDLHDAAIVQVTSGATGVLSGSCGIPDGHGFELELRIYGEHGSVIFDIETERLQLKLQGGRSVVIDVQPGSWTYSCQGPATALADIARGHGRNESPGHVGARAVETLHAILASARNGNSSFQIEQIQI
jgi:predicted dehydrogenase